MIKLKDVAKHANVSIPTANQILNGYESRFSPKTVQKVKAAAKTLSYSPNISARSLKYNKSFTIGILYYKANYLFMGDFLQKIQTLLLKNHYAPIFLIHENSTEEEENLKICLDRRVDGLIVNPTLDSHRIPNLKNRYKELQKKDFPIVEVFGKYMTDTPSFEFNDIDNEYYLTKKLIKKGAKNIAYITYSLTDIENKKSNHDSFSKKIYKGYLKAIKEEKKKKHIFVTQLQDEVHTEGLFYWNTYKIADKIFNNKENIDGVVCYTEDQAQALIDYANIHKIDLNKFHIATKIRASNKIIIKYPIETIKREMKELGEKVTTKLIEMIDTKKNNSKKKL